MKVLKSRKSVIAALALSAIALTSCSRVKTAELNNRIYNIEDNSLLKDYDEELTLKDRLLFDSTGLKLFISRGFDNNQLSVSYDTDSEASNCVYEYINNTINEMTEYDTLGIYLSQGNLDFSKVDVSKFRQIMFGVADVDFDYKPFYNNTFTFLTIDISSKTNINSIVDFLENTKTENASIHISFEDKMNVEDSQRVIDALAKMKSVDSIDLSHSNINELNVSDLACCDLTINHPTTNESINYNITINDAVKKLTVESSFPEQYDKTPYLEKFKVNSNNENLSIDFQLFRYANDDDFSVVADDKSVIDVPENIELNVSNLDISNVSTEWLRKFSNLNLAFINPYLEKKSFLYNSKLMTIDDAIVDKCLKQIGVRYTISNDSILIDADLKEPLGKFPEELYPILKGYFAGENIDHLLIYNIDDQIDFSKFDLSNISKTSFYFPGPNFDFTPFYDQNITYLDLQILENANHERILEFLKNISDHGMKKIDVSFAEVEECQNTELQQRYIDALSNEKNLKEVIIRTSIADHLNYEDLTTENLSLFIESNKDIVNYDFSINDQVQLFNIYTYYDKEYGNNVYIGDIKVNSNNNKLTTNLRFSNYSLDNYFNVNLDRNFTKITVPNASGLKLFGISFDDIDYKAIEQLDYLNNLYIHEDGNEDYQFCYYSADDTFDETLKEFKDKNKDRECASLTLNNYFK